jgi:hypothetical protein
VVVVYPRSFSVNPSCCFTLTSLLRVLRLQPQRKRERSRNVLFRMEGASELHTIRTATFRHTNAIALCRLCRLYKLCKPEPKYSNSKVTISMFLRSFAACNVAVLEYPRTLEHRIPVTKGRAPHTHPPPLHLHATPCPPVDSPHSTTPMSDLLPPRSCSPECEVHSFCTAATLRHLESYATYATTHMEYQGVYRASRAASSHLLT